MFLAEVDISKTVCFMTTQTFSQEVTKFIPCGDVTRFDGITLLLAKMLNASSSSPGLILLFLLYLWVELQYFIQSDFY